MKKYYFLLCFLLSPVLAFSQFDYSFRYDYPEFCDSCEEELSLRIETLGFFKDNEYVAKITQGYTLPGYYFRPSLTYYANEKVRLNAGVQLLQYHGLENFGVFSPILSLHVKFNPHLEMVFGTLKSTVHHKVLEPLYSPENQLTRPLETGVQFLFTSKYLDFDVWADWEKYITYGDTVPERFTYGFCPEVKLHNSKTWDLTLPIQTLIRHHGGEINEYPERLVSLLNQSAGIAWTYKTECPNFKSISLQQHFMLYKDMNSRRVYLDNTDGYGIYSNLLLNWLQTQVMFSYWYGDNFFAYKGHPMYQSYVRESGTYNKYRKVVSAKYARTWALGENINFAAIGEMYYDLGLKEINSSVSANISLTHDFFIKKF